MHKIHITDGVVLQKRLLGESNTAIMLLTPELGLVRASARSARKEVSKLRFGLEPLTIARFSLVKGRHEWKLTGTHEVSRELLAPAIESYKRSAAGRISKLLLRLVAGEEGSPALFMLVKEGFSALAAAASKADAEALECVLVLRILANLGYLPARPELAPFVGDAIFSLELAAEAARARSLLIKAINESLQATGL